MFGKSPKYPRILIEGDSWVAHPFVTNIAWSLHRYFGNRVHILNISSSGDLISDIGNPEKGQYKLLDEILSSSLYDFDLLFLSGGGNDLLSNNNSKLSLESLLKGSTGNDPRSFLNDSILLKIIDSINSGYNSILELAQKLNPNLPIIAHTYDRIYPRNDGADIIINDVLGPWVYPAMIKKGITDQNIQQSITDYLLSSFTRVLDELSTHFKPFDFIETKGTIPAHQGSRDKKVKFWNDEIHPDSRGFNLLIDGKIGPIIRDEFKISDNRSLYINFFSVMEAVKVNLNSLE